MTPNLEFAFFSLSTRLLHFTFTGQALLRPLGRLL